jgi:hypothetical protein
MTREATTLVVADLSDFARKLRRGLAEHLAGHPEPPGHVTLMNLLARAAGHRNLQTLKAAPGARLPGPAAVVRAAVPPVVLPVKAPVKSPPPLTEHARRALALFDAAGRLQRWPAKLSVQRLAMWVLWTRFDAKRPYTEREVNAILRDAHAFGDHATLRRELVNHRLLARKSDCSEYRKLAARPDDETRALLGAWRAQCQAAAARP